MLFCNNSIIGQDIDNLVKEYRDNIISFGKIQENNNLTKSQKDKLSKPYNLPVPELSKKLYEVLIKNNIPNLSNYKKLIISPDGELNVLPFEALIKDDKYLIETKEIIYVSSAKEFLQLQESIAYRPKNSNDIVVFSNPNYDQLVTMKATKNTQKSLSNQEPLESIKTDELSVIDDIYKEKVIPFKGNKATKENLFKVVSPLVLHISTHSIYFNKNNPDINPLLKSVLALKDFNEMIYTGDYLGVFTASDFTTLDLYNTELVFLSSCQSGLGYTFLSEGNYGFSRAAKIAGAKRVISTIWSVSADASEFLIDKFYKKLKKSNNIEYIESLRKTKKEMIQHKKYHHPFYWAGFLESGV